MGANSRRHRQAGFSLVELMISLAIGLVVVGAVFAAYVGTGLSSRHTRAMAQITEDASIALSVLRSAIANTSYIVATGSDGNGFINAVGSDGRPNTLRGCNNTFGDLDVGIGALTCAEGDGPHAIAVSYQADAQNSPVSGAGVPLDCLGNEVPDAGGVRLAYQRFFVDAEGETLRCQGPGNDDDQALVDNIVDMRIRYGVAGTAAGSMHRVVRYLDAAEIRDEDVNLFDRVVSVRVCVTIASETNVLDTSSQYTNCAGEQEDPPGGADDRRMYRSFTSTIVLPNRLEAMQ